MARLLAAALCALTLGACGGGGGGSAGGPISFQLFGDPEEIAIYREVAKAYTAKTGNRVDIVAVGDRKDHLAKLTAGAAAKRLPDVFLINYRNVGGLASRGAIAPVEGLDTDAFFPVTTEAFTFEGKLQCVPQNAASLVVYYNADLFEAAGLEKPAPGWSYDEFLTTARKLRTGGRFGVAIEPNAIRTAPYVWGAGGELVDDQERPTAFTLDTPQARRGLEQLLTLRREELAPDRRAAASRPADERFLQGEAAMYLSSRRDVPTFRTIDDFTWDVAPFPIIDEPASVLHSDGFCVSRAGKTEAAQAFVRFAAGTDGQTILARGGRTVPSRRAVAESPAFLGSTPPASNQVFLDQIEAMRRLPTTRNWTRIEETVDLAIEELYYGGLTIDEAIERIERETKGRF